MSYSQGALVYNNKDFFAVLFPPLSIGKLSNMLCFGIKIDNLLNKLVNFVFKSTKIIQNNTSFVENINLIKTPIKNTFDSIFIIYYQNTR